jgi:hypothetical protein
VKRWVIVLAALTVLTTAVAAVAAIPDTNGVIHGCRNTKTGVLRVIDTEKGQTCSNKEAALTWNQTGPQGPARPQGPEGPQGPQGPSGVSGVEVVSRSLHTDNGFAAVAAICPDEKFAVSGGYSYVPDNPDITDWSIDVQRNQPWTTPPTVAPWWMVWAKADVPGTLTTYGYCIYRP